ncbi:MAG: YbjN domain-containing protein [Selenomonadaceae bacterium]|nr:YbjN domain-containing protein [Selenomonadaceae bacterium]
MAFSDFDYPQVLEDIFNERDLHFDVKQVGEKTIFRLPMSAKNCPGLNVHLNVSEHGDAQLRAYLAENVKDYQRDALLSVLNSLNARYRYITLSIDSDGDILSTYDFTFFSEDEEVITKQVLTMLYLVSDIMDKCIPKIMKAIWSTQKDDDEED